MTAARSQLEPASADAELVGRALGGDDRAFEGLYRRHVQRVAGLVYRLTGGDPDLDELVQATFVAAYRGLPTLRNPDRFGSWLSSIAVYQVRQVLAQRQRTRSFLRRWADVRTVQGEWAAAHGDEAVRELAALPDRLRLPFVLHRLEGHTVAQTAELCGISTATVKRRCADAAHRLARRMS